MSTVEQDPTATSPAATTGAMADLSRDLQALRARAGDVSYGEIAARITRARAENGMPAAAASIARSTVYDAFRPARRRLNPTLIREIVLALGGDPDEAERWRERCIAARAAEASATEPAAPAAEPEASAAEPTASAAESERSSPSRPHTTDARAAARPSPWPVLPPLRPDRLLALTLLVACIGINHFGTRFVLNFDLPLWLDTVGTAIAAVCLGPWTGAVVAIASMTLGSLSSTFEYFPFVLVAIVAALMWGYGVRAWGMGRTPLRYFALGVATPVACTLVAAPITVLVFGGETAHTATKGLLHQLQGVGANLWEAALASNIGASVADKLIAAGVALLVAAALNRHLTPAPRPSPS